MSTTHADYDAQGRPRSRLLPEDTVVLAIAMVTLLALILRLVRLGTPSLWVDELITIHQGRMLGTTLFEQFLDDAHCPLPMLVTALLARVSEHEAWLRLPSALLGALSIPLMFEVARRLTNARAGLIAAFLLAIHPMHIDHSQEVRGYAYLIFFGLAATWVVLEAGPRLSWRRLPLLVFLGVCAGLSNLQGLFWMGGLALGVAVGGRVPVREWGRWAVGFVLILLLLAPWWLKGLEVHEVGRLAPSASTGEMLRGESTFNALAIPYAGFVLSMGSSLGPSDDELHADGGQSIPPRHLPAIGLAAILVLLTAGSGWIALKGRRRELLAWIVVPLVLAAVLALRNVKPFNPRYVIAVLPVLLIFVSAGIDRVNAKLGVAMLLGWVLLTGVSLARYWFDPLHAHEDIRGAARLIAEREGRDDAVLVPAVGQVFRFYYRGDSPWAMTSRADIAASGRDVDTALDDFHSERRYLWFVRSRPWFGDPNAEMLGSMQSRYRQLASFDLPGAMVLLFDRQQSPESGLLEGEVPRIGPSRSIEGAPPDSGAVDRIDPEEPKR